jgi:hypothetical protein
VVRFGATARAIPLSDDHRDLEARLRSMLNDEC